MISTNYGECAAKIAELEKRLEEARKRNHDIANQVAAYQCLCMDVLEVLPVTDENKELIELVKRAADGEVVVCEQQS